jgi:hypothetical protein
VVGDLKLLRFALGAESVRREFCVAGSRKVSPTPVIAAVISTGIGGFVEGAGSVTLNKEWPPDAGPEDAL